MKTYIQLIKHKIHWLHLASAVLILGVFTSISLQQYAAQIFYSAPSMAAARTPAKHILKQGRTRPEPATASQAVQTAPAPAPATPGDSPPKASLLPPPPATPVPQTPAAPLPPAPATDIASESICPGQASTASTASVLACMASYARQQHGIAAISSNASLVSAATAKVQDMAACGYSHTACGRPFNYWFAPNGYTGNCSAENIAQGQLTPGEVFVAWMNSPGHRANILNASYTDIGGAFAASGNLWVMELGGC